MTKAAHGVARAKQAPVHVLDLAATPQRYVIGPYHRLLVFTVEQRTATIERILAFARMDSRVTAAAVVGSLAHGGGDRWSDVDLTFAVDDGTAIDDVLSDWTAWIAHELDATRLFDLPAGDTIYRVFLLPGGLQLDVSFTSAGRFGAGGPRFQLLFGETHPKAPSTPADPAELFGWGVAYARDGRALIERGRLWMAEHMISSVRNNALAIACIARGLPSQYGRGYDDLPAELLERFAGAFVSPPLTQAALRSAYAVAVEGLLRESAPLMPIAETVASSVREWLGGVSE